ncbi:MAG: family 43 glycosylhydrolase [Terrimonas sp.]|nr:family 43 glycosylhydrolase [Terrimonas sp.]
MIKQLVFAFLFTGSHLLAVAQYVSKVWVADKGNGMYKNPVINADYSDPDAIRVGDDYYMVSSSFTHIPGLPLLHSKDLVNWELAGHALTKQPPYEVYDQVQHGTGVWAPSIRYHNNEFYIYYPDPDYGIYVTKARQITGPWSVPVLVASGKGIIDPCPLWDDNGKAYLVAAFAGSRAGIKSILVMYEMNREGTQFISEPVMVYDGHITDPTVEGPKLYKRNGYYYIFAPAGGVSTGWQLVLRSRNIYGPYERKLVMAQGNTSINGPHQGAWVTTNSGEDWFLHFQDKGVYGRVVHLQPLHWIQDWPVIGNDNDGDGIGEPVLSYKKPGTGKSFPITTPPESDEFNTVKLGLQWQWQANPKQGWLFPTSSGFLRMFSVYKPDTVRNLWTLPNVLAQKFPADSFMATVKLKFSPNWEEERMGLQVLGTDYAFISLVKRGGSLYIEYNICKEADKGSPESNVETLPVRGEDFYLRVSVRPGGICSFAFSEDGREYRNSATSFNAKPGRWVGAKIGLFCTRNNKTNNAGYADIDWFRIERN